MRRKGLCLYKTSFLCALPLLLLAAGSAGNAPGAVLGQLTALAPGELWSLISPGLLGARSGARDCTECCEHSQASIWLPTLSGTSDQPLPCPQEALSALAFSPDGKYIVTGEVSGDHGGVGGEGVFGAIPLAPADLRNPWNSSFRTADAARTVGDGFWAHPGAVPASALTAPPAALGAEPSSSKWHHLPRMGTGLLYVSGTWKRRVRRRKCWATSMAWPAWVFSQHEAHSPWATSTTWCSTSGTGR